MITIDKLKILKESEDKVEFKKGEGGNISYRERPSARWEIRCKLRRSC